VVDYLLYRAAQITHDHDYDYFVVARMSTQRKTSYLNSGSAFPLYYGCYGPYYALGCGPPLFMQTTTSYPINSYQAFATIVLGRGSKPSDNVHAYEASQVLKHLTPLIKQHGEQSDQ